MVLRDIPKNNLTCYCRDFIFSVYILKIELGWNNNLETQTLNDNVYLYKLSNYKKLPG